MPTVCNYSDKEGVYLRSRSNGRSVTFQLSPAAEGLLDDLGYNGGDAVHWQFLQPLCECGHIYMNNSGMEVSEEIIEADASAPAQPLPRKKQQQFENFFNRDIPKINKISSKENDKSSITDSQPISDMINDEKRSFIEQWSPTDDEYEANLNRLARADDPNAILQSVSHHATEHPMQPERFRISSQDKPIYSFTTSNIPWTVHDFRSTDNHSLDVELFIEIQPGTSSAQSLTLGKQITEWYTNDTQFSSTQIDDLVAVYPDVSYYVQHAATDAQIGALTNSTTAPIPPSDKDRIDVVDTHPQTPLEAGEQGIGVIVSVGERTGRIRAHTGHTLPFMSESHEDNEITTVELVSFTVETHDGTQYAAHLQNEETGPSGPAFLRSWPNWHDQPLDALRQRWTAKDQKTDDATGTMLSFDISDTEHETERIRTHIDAVTVFVIETTAADDGDSNTIIEDAVKDQLKEMIDGNTPPSGTHGDPQEVEVCLPTTLLSMIDTSVEAFSSFETRSDFFTTALHQHLGTADTTEMTVHISKSYRTVLEHLAEKQGQSVDAFTRETIENTLRDEIHGINET